MSAIAPHISPEHWLRQLFSSQAARDGGVVRRQCKDIERLVGRDAFETELRRRGFRAVENAGQYVVFCYSEAIRIVK
ncbi:MAG: N-(5'-phosphoribosyl)anthranilate isomerase [Pseudomonadota bacterium]